MQRIGSRRIRTQFLLAMFLGMNGSQAEEYSSDHRPVWSRDGRSIIFMSNRDRGDWELYRMNLDGSGLQRLTESPGWDGYACLSPDGSLLLFDSGRNDRHNIMLLDLSSGRTESLVTSEQFIGGARWSPDGQWIVYMSEESGNRELYLARHDFDERRQLTNTPLSEGDPTFSPNGSRVAFSSQREDGWGIDILDLAGDQRIRKLESSKGRIYGLDWSPDGRRIVFNSDADGDQELYLLDPESGATTRLTDNHVSDHLALWSPNGSYLIYTSEPEEREVIFLRDMTTNLTLRIVTTE